MRLTQRVIEGLTCPHGKKDVLVFDDEQRGLGVRVTSSGGKSYIAQFRSNGQKRRLPIVSCSAVSLAQAREMVRIIMGEVAKGGDPAFARKAAALAAKRRAAHDALTLDALLEQWQALHLAGKRPRYASEAARAVRFAFKRYLTLPAADLDRAVVVRVLDGLTREGKAAMASRTAAYGRAAYQWALRRGSLAANPFSSLPSSPIASRERVLTDGELAAVWKSAKTPGSFNAIIRMLILTGQRREEVAAMSWAELTDDHSVWTIPASRAKNGVAHVVPLSGQAQTLLRDLPRHDRSALVFPGLRGQFSGFGKAKAKLDAASGVNGWRLHDLRRTMATGLQKLGVRLEVTEAVLNHVSGSKSGIVGVYQRHDWAAEKAAALAAWGEHVAAIVEGREQPSRITAFRTVAGGRIARLSVE